MASSSRDPRWRYNAIVGMLLAFSGVVGLWGIGFFSFDLFRSVLERTNMPPGDVTFWIGMTSLLQNPARSSASTPSRT